MGPTSATQSKDAKRELSLERKQEIAAKLTAYMNATGQSDDKVASELYATPSMKTNIFNIRTGKWDDISDAYWLKIESGLNRYYGEWKVLETSAYNSALEMCRDCQNFQKMAILCGYSGNGKSQALKHHTFMNKKSTYFISCNTGDSKKEFLKQLLHAMGKGSFKGGCGDMLREIARLVSEVKNPLIIIDEAGSLKDTMIVMLKDLYNMANGKVGILLAGVEYTYSTLVKMTKDEKMGYPELFSRIQYKYTMPKVSKREVIDICVTNGMTDTMAATWVYERCGGDLRKVRGIVTTALSKHGSEVSATQLNEAFGSHTFNF